MILYILEQQAHSNLPENIPQKRWKYCFQNISKILTSLIFSSHSANARWSERDGEHKKEPGHRTDHWGRLRYTARRKPSVRPTGQRHSGALTEQLGCRVRQRSERDELQQFTWPTHPTLAIRLVPKRRERGGQTMLSVHQPHASLQSRFERQTEHDRGEMNMERMNQLSSKTIFLSRASDEFLYRRPLWLKTPATTNFNSTWIFTQVPVAFVSFMGRHRSSWATYQRYPWYPTKGLVKK